MQRAVWVLFAFWLALCALAYGVVNDWSAPSSPIVQVVDDDGDFVGTGFAITRDLVLTAGHVVNAVIEVRHRGSEAQREETTLGDIVSLRAADGARLQSKVVLYHRYADICALRLEKEFNWSAPIPIDYCEFVQGEKVTVVGCAPLRRKLPNGEIERAATIFVLPDICVVAGKATMLWGALWRSDDEDNCDFVMLSNSLVGGSSGSPVLNDKQRALAIFVGHKDNFGIATYLYQVRDELEKLRLAR